MSAIEDLKTAKSIQQRELQKEKEKSGSNSISADDAQKTQEIDKRM